MFSVALYLMRKKLQNIFITIIRMNERKWKKFIVSNPTEEREIAQKNRIVPECEYLWMFPSLKHTVVKIMMVTKLE